MNWLGDYQQAYGTAPCILHVRTQAVWKQSTRLWTTNSAELVLHVARARGTSLQSSISHCEGNYERVRPNQRTQAAAEPALHAYPSLQRNEAAFRENPVRADQAVGTSVQPAFENAVYSPFPRQRAVPRTLGQRVRRPPQPNAPRVLVAACESTSSPSATRVCRIELCESLARGRVSVARSFFACAVEEIFLVACVIFSVRFHRKITAKISSGE